jgi:hypothetical protein
MRLEPTFSESIFASAVRFFGIAYARAMKTMTFEFQKTSKSVNSFRFTPVRAGIVLTIYAHLTGMVAKPAPTVGHDLFRSSPVGATLVVARVGGHFSTMRVGSLNNLFCRFAQAKSTMLEAGKVLAQNLVGVEARLEVIYE